MVREASVARKTRETDIRLDIRIGAGGAGSVNTGVGFFDHMLELLSRFSGIDMNVQAKGDLHVDTHHLVEDTGICMGKALKKAIGEGKGIRRFGFASVPMDEVLVSVSLDISGRPMLIFNVPFVKGPEGSFQTEDAREFLKAFVVHGGLTLHVNLAYGDNLHHVNEAIFKAMGLALKDALGLEESGGIPSTKGLID